MNLNLFILLIFLPIVFSKLIYTDYNSTFYENKYQTYKNKYNQLINITETNKFPEVDGKFIYYFQPFCNPVNIYISHNLTNRTISYKDKFSTLLHELTHFFQCLYSNKLLVQKKIIPITKFLPSYYLRSFVKKYYNKTTWNIEFEAYHITEKPNKFTIIENYIHNNDFLLY